MSGPQRERQAQREDALELTEKLDQDWKEIRALLARKAPRPEARETEKPKVGVHRWQRPVAWGAFPAPERQGFWVRGHCWGPGGRRSLRVRCTFWVNGNAHLVHVYCFSIGTVYFLLYFIFI